MGTRQMQKPRLLFPFSVYLRPLAVNEFGNDESLPFDLADRAEVDQVADGFGV
jgi:hypothetical protein